MCSKLSGSRGEVFDRQRDLQLFDAWTLRALVMLMLGNPRLMARHIKQFMDSLALQALITWQPPYFCFGHEKDSHNTNRPGDSEENTSLCFSKSL